MIKISLKLNLNEEKTILSKTSNKKCEEQVYKPLKLTDLQKDIINSVFYHQIHLKLHCYINLT